MGRRLQEWNQANAVAKAFSIGRGEAAAVSNLMTKIPRAAVDFLTESVRSRGMSRYLSHEVLGKDLLNSSFTSGINGLEHWKDQLRNTDELDDWTQLEHFLGLWIYGVLLLVYYSDARRMCFGFPVSGPADGAEDPERPRPDTVVHEEGPVIQSGLSQTSVLWPVLTFCAAAEAHDAPRRLCGGKEELIQPICQRVFRPRPEPRIGDNISTRGRFFYQRLQARFFC